MAVHAFIEPVADPVELALTDRQATEAAVGELIPLALPADHPQHAGVHLTEGVHRLYLFAPGTSGHDRKIGVKKMVLPY